MKHRQKAIEGFEKGDAELAIISIESINALLPALEGGKTYKVEVDTEKYRELKSETREIKCKKCKTENPINSVKQYDLELDWLEQILAKNKTQKVWVCNKCHKSNIFNTDDITVTKNGEPYFYKVMPAPPQRQAGIRGRMTFNQEFQKWFSIAISEIESQIGIYRSEYLSQQDQEQEMIIEAEEH